MKMIMVVCDGWTRPAHPRRVLREGTTEGGVSHGICHDCKLRLDYELYLAGVLPDPRD
jgi:hypothetical protein